MKYLLDTNFVIDLHKRDPVILATMLDNSINFSQCTISVITRLETLGYSELTEQDKVSLTQLLAKFSCIELTIPIQQKTIEIRQIQKIKLPDSIILATALCHDLHLLTRDGKLKTRFENYL